jgi:hypothetical protein
MGRLSLSEKLKKRSDYEDVLKRVTSANNPVKYICDSMGCSYGAALKCAADLGLKFSKTHNYSDEFPSKFVNSMDLRFSQITSTRELLEVREMLKGYPIELLRDIFKIIFNRETDVNYSFDLVNAITYHFQVKYYNNFYGFDISDRVNNRYKEIVNKC